MINRSPSSAIEYKLPEELWSGNRPVLKHLRRIGCAAYVHTRNAKTSPRAVKGSFVGYPQGTKGFRVWLPEEESCTISRSVIFHEEEVYKEAEKEVEVKSVQNDLVYADKGKSVQREKKSVSFSPNLIQGPFKGLHDSEASTSENVVQIESSVSGGAVSDSEVESAVQEEETEEHLDHYILARDRKRRETKLPSKYDDFDVVAYALSAASDIEIEEPKSY